MIVTKPCITTAQQQNTQTTQYILDTNVLIHDPNAVLNFEEHHVMIPMTVLEELDKLKINESFFFNRERGTGRPTKKERRQIDKLKNSK